ncbi:MAG TPA: ATP-binding cassette domain-containing protein, partial [Acidimicrobiales bacterium]|nr:ATP-binding cassette domain-containing protein [Acidimicrobiales bacterium]
STATEEVAGRSYLELSGGEQARVDLARIIAQDAPIVLLDEPTASLDVRHQEAVMAVARGLARAGRAVLCVLHDLNLATTHADRVAVLARGRLVAAGPPRSALTGELLSTVYGHPVEVVAHPRHGRPLVLPAAGRVAAGT